jgi:hypothetical protein
MEHHGHGLAEPRIDLAYRLLDDQLVDAGGRRCGKVDDLELTGAPGGRLEVTAILVGSGIRAGRGPGRLGRWWRRRAGAPVWGRTARRVPWSAVDDVTTRIALRRDAEDLGLAGGDLELSTLVGRVPGA